MNKAKKRVLALALVVSLAALVSVGSLAWFSAQDTVNNQFMVATSTDDTADEIFSVDVYEYVDDSGVKQTTGATYADILPGETLKKEAHVVNTGYYDQYIRVIVTISDATAWQTMLGTSFNDTTLLACFGGYDPTMWTNVTSEVDTTNNAIRVVMYYVGTLDGNDTANDTATDVKDITVFNNVVIPAAMDQTAAVAFGTDGFTISVNAQAVQTENVGTGAYAAFATVGMTY